MAREYGMHHGSSLRVARAMWGRRKWLATSAFAAVFSAAVSLVMAMPDLYRAKATVLVKPEWVSEVVAASSAGEVESRLQTISEEILSRARLQGLIDRFDLYPELRRRASPEAVIERMRRDIRLERREVELRWGQGTTVAFALSYQGWEPRTVAAVVNALASSYVEENERLRPRPTAGAQAGAQAQAAAQAAAGVDVLAQLRRNLAELRAQFSDRYPDVIRLKAEIEALERQREAMARAGAGALPPPARAPDPRLERPIWGQFRVLDAAVPPRDPVAPNRIRLMLMGLIMAFGIAGAAVLLAEQFDTSFHRLDELWVFTKMPVLASVPRIVTRADTWRRRLGFGLVGILAVSGLALLVRASYFVGQASGELVWMLAQRGSGA